MESKYNDYATGGGSGGSYDNTELRPTANSAFEGDLVRVFGTDSNYGDSLGVVFEDAELTDGLLYLDPEKGVYKTFSWKESTGFSVAESVENGDEPSADDAPEVLPKTYGDTQKRYELVGAVVSEVVDEDGEVVVNASSKSRNFEWNGEDDVEWGDFESLGGSPIPFGEVVIWNNGTKEHGANASALRLAEMLTTLGDEAVVDEDDIYNWLADTSGNNIIRDELEGRRLRFFIVRRDSQDSDRSYNYPVLEDVKTGEPIQRNHGDGDSGN